MTAARRSVRTAPLASSCCLCALWLLAIPSVGCVENLDLDDSVGGSSTTEDPANDRTGGAADTETSGGSETGPQNIPPSAEAFAEARCAALLGCGCIPSGDRWADVAVCEQDLVEVWGERLDSSAGLEVNMDCWNAQLSDLTGDDCTTAPPLAQQPVADAFFCDLFEGTGEVGEGCGPVTFGSYVQYDCRPGLACEAGRCRAQPESGDACLESPEEGGFFSPCPNSEGLACVEGVCAPIPTVGELCPAGWCAEGAACIDGACVAARPEGAACTFGSDCVSSRCADDVCVAPAAAVCGPYFEERPPPE